jgi:hypothetical protein
MQAWSFIVFHELGHHAMQHLGAPAAGPAGLAYTEIDKLVSASISFAKSSDGTILRPRTDAQLSEALLFRHANELEADRYAIAKMYIWFFRKHSAVAINSANYLAMTAMSERSRTRLWLVTIGIVFLLFEVAARSRAANTHPKPLFRLQHLLEFTRIQASPVVPSGSLTEFDKGYGDATRDLTLVAQKLGIGDLFTVRPEDAVYKERMMEIRASRPRMFNDDASE